jgi:hypothetical protein
MPRAKPPELASDRTRAGRATTRRLRTGRFQETAANLAKMAFNDSSTWPELADQVDKKSLSHTAHVAVMTYASEMFSWYAGNLEADVYFCPERHATYFGSFYMKDIPAMGNPNFSISTSLTGDSGEAFLAALSEPQRQLVTQLVERQRADLAEIVNTRRATATATELRRFLAEGSVDMNAIVYNPTLDQIVLRLGTDGHYGLAALLVVGPTRSSQ